MKHRHRIALAVLLLTSAIALFGQGQRGPQFRDVIPKAPGCNTRRIKAP